MTAQTPAAAPAQLAASGRVPLLILFVSAAIWLVLGSALGLIASIKFHAPNLLADCAVMSYGRVRPAANDALLYGFCLQAGLGVALWLLMRLGRTGLAQSWLVVLGAMLFNFGVTLGCGGILGGDSTGFENLEMPRYAALFVFMAWVMIGVAGVATFHQRTERPLYVSQWFVFVALFWFAWIYSTANLLLVVYPVRGVAQSVINWWFSDNLVLVWLGLVGLATAFYFVPKLLGRELHSQYLALVSFWVLILFGSWCGISNSAPVPAWMPALSTVAAVFTVLVPLTVGLNFYHTCQGQSSRIGTSPSLQFIGFGVVAFILAGIINACGALADQTGLINFTWFSAAKAELHTYGFFALVMFGALYFIVPQLMGREFPFPKLVRAHFWMAALGTLFVVVPLMLGGIVEAIRFHDPTVLFPAIMKGTLHFVRVSTVGELLIVAGNVLFLLNLGGLVNQYYRARAEAAYAAATADLFKAEAAKP